MGQFAKDYLCNDFLIDVVYMIYLVYSAAVLHRISYSKIAIAGYNGAGKTTLIKLIMRLYDPNEGEIFLDEPSSALDLIAEYHLNHSMLSAAEHKSVVFISHRLSTTRIADRIYMIENGSIIEEGSHAALLEKGGKYAHMWSVQAGQYL